MNDLTVRWFITIPTRCLTPHPVWSHQHLDWHSPDGCRSLMRWCLRRIASYLYSCPAAWLKFRLTRDRFQAWPDRCSISLGLKSQILSLRSLVDLLHTGRSAATWQSWICARLGWQRRSKRAVERSVVKIRFWFAFEPVLNGLKLKQLIDLTSTKSQWAITDAESER